MAHNEKYYKNKKLFSDLRKTADEIRVLESKANVARPRLQGWDESHAEFVKRRREEAREALLFEHVPERRCVICEELKLKSKQWVVLKRAFSAVLDNGKAVTIKVLCLSCYHKLFRNKNKSKCRKGAVR